MLEIGHYIISSLGTRLQLSDGRIIHITRENGILSDPVGQASDYDDFDYEDYGPTENNLTQKEQDYLLKFMCHLKFVTPEGTISNRFATRSVEYGWPELAEHTFDELSPGRRRYFMGKFRHKIERINIIIRCIQRTCLPHEDPVIFNEIDEMIDEVADFLRYFVMYFIEEAYSGKTVNGGLLIEKFKSDIIG